MPDITMCRGVNNETDEQCPLKAGCHRFTETPDKWRQLYFTSAPFRDGECQHFWPTDREQEPRT